MPSGGKFPQAETGGGIIAVVWQELALTRQTESEVSGNASLSLMVKTADGPWKTVSNVAGPYPFVGKEASIYSLAVNDQGHILLAVSSSDREIQIIKSTDGGNVFNIVSVITSDYTVISPKVFYRDGGGYLLFVTRQSMGEGTGDALSTYYSVSEDGTAWSPLALLVNDPGKQLNFLPYHASHNGREFVVFQVLETGERPSYQLYLKVSSDRGRTWGPLIWLSGFNEEQIGAESTPVLYDNQRPFIAPVNGKLAVTWERRFMAGAPQVYYMEVDDSGKILGDPERVSQGVRSCRYPQIAVADGVTYLFWFDNRAGDEQIIAAWKEGIFWQDNYLSRMAGVSIFQKPVVLDNRLQVVWENQRAGVSRIIFLAPDRTAPAPFAVPLDFAAGRRVKQDRFSVTWNLPRDSSGIAGFAYSMDRDPGGLPPRQIMVPSLNNRAAAFTINEDGYWYFHLAAQDYAGNWSDTSGLSIFRDTTPPGPVTIAEPEMDDNGFLLSNSITINWEKPEEDDPIGGYSYDLQFLGER
ncbi:MAG: hypothetical protein E4H36_12055, partial [Spirochaetales bacterium]